LPKGKVRKRTSRSKSGNMSPGEQKRGRGSSGEGRLNRKERNYMTKMLVRNTKR